MPEPYKQGRFDSACGLYAIVNAFRHFLHKADDEKLFRDVARYLIDLDPAILLLEGTGRNQLNGAISYASSWCAEKRVNVQIERPFWNQSAASLSVLKRRLADHFANHSNSASAIIEYEFNNGIQGWSHWTAIISVSESSMRILDSSIPITRILFSRCRVWDNLSHHKRRPYALDTTATFLFAGS